MDLIDADWIAQRLSRQRGELKELAAFVGITQDKLTKILNGTREVQAREVPRFVAYFDTAAGGVTPGMNEPAAAAPVQDATPATQRVGLAGAIAPDIKHPLLYKITRAYPGCALLPGDLLVLDTAAGDIDGLVLATHWRDDGSAETLLRRRLGHTLLSPDPLDSAPLMQIGNGPELAIIGRVACILRSDPLGERGAA